MDTPANQRAAYVYADAFEGLCFVTETTPARTLDDLADGDGYRDGDGDDEDTTDVA